MITAESPILAPPSTSPEQVIAYLIHRGSVYTPYDIRIIVEHYWRFAPAVGVDPLIAIAQCIHETSARQPDGRWWPLSSWWAQRPRRNPAGLGVTGRTRKTSPPDATWAWDDRTRIWRHGLSFPSWEVSSQAHIGHLLGYALRDDQMTREQYAMACKSPRFKILPPGYRGCAPALRGLNGRWAVPGTTYAQRIAAIAQRILAHPA